MNVEAPLLPDFPSGQIFSGFNAQYRVQLHDSLFELVWFGEGRWDWHTLYHMPIFLRKYWTKKINDIVDAQHAAIKKANTKTSKPLPTKR